MGLQAAIANTPNIDYGPFGIGQPFQADAAEDALTGLHQAVYCVNQVKWRKNSRKMIFLATDERWNSNYDKAKVCLSYDLV